MSHRHSKGPWSVFGKPQYAGFKVVDADGRSVASFPSSSTRPNEEREANAHLISAAPDLLEALELALPMIRGHQEDEKKRERYAKTVAAIAKAKGKAA